MKHVKRIELSEGQVREFDYWRRRYLRLLNRLHEVSKRLKLPDEEDDGGGGKGPEPGSSGPRGRVAEIEAGTLDGIGGYDLAGSRGDEWTAPPLGNGFSGDLDGDLFVMNGDGLQLEIDCTAAATIEVTIEVDGAPLADMPIPLGSGVSYRFFPIGAVGSPGEVTLRVRRTSNDSSPVHAALYVL
ncbi:MAG: hypothetical protein RIT81_15660 [Deltaproteobacteria bacterium]